ncbi:MAG: hypothetical protein WCG45_06410 [bacterium]
MFFNDPYFYIISAAMFISAVFAILDQNKQKKVTDLEENKKVKQE